jgi:hypothetical protein
MPSTAAAAAVSSWSAVVPRSAPRGTGTTPPPTPTKMDEPEDDPRGLGKEERLPMPRISMTLPGSPRSLITWHPSSYRRKQQLKRGFFSLVILIAVFFLGRWTVTATAAAYPSAAAAAGKDRYMVRKYPGAVAAAVGEEGYTTEQTGPPSPPPPPPLTGADKKTLQAGGLHSSTSELNLSRF